MSQVDFYQDYFATEGWARRDADLQAGYLADIWRETGLPPNLTILEIGSGSGSFLDWAKNAGHRVVGVELQKNLVEQARLRGHSMHQWPLVTGDIEPRSIDLVCAFDVIEHMTVDDVCSLFALLAPVFRNRQKYIMTFPNAQSPFSITHQFGDITHKSQFSPATVDQIARRFGMAVTKQIVIRSYPSGLRSIKRWIAYRMRDVIETFIGLAYFGQKIPLDPNAIVLIEQTD